MGLVRPDEHDGLGLRQQLAKRRARRRRAGGVEDLVEVLPRRRRQCHADDLLQLVDGPGGPGAARDDAAMLAGVDRVLDRCFRLVQQLRHAAARDVVLGVGVRVDALQALDVGLDESQTPPGRRVVTIDHQTLAERRFECRIDAHNLLPQPGGIQQLLA